MLDHMDALEAESAALQYSGATVTRIEQLAMGDRVCVDLCSNMSPGEGMLVGNFCRALFLVHSEVCLPPRRITAAPGAFSCHPCPELLPCQQYLAVSCCSVLYL